MFTTRIITNYSLLCNYFDFRYFLRKKKGEKEETSKSYCNSMNRTIQNGPKAGNINAK